MTPADTKIWGFQHVEWREPDEHPTQEPHWPRNLNCPVAGQTRWVRIENWHRTVIGARLWLLYRPGLSHFNGWDEHPEELDLSAIVECELVEIAHDELPEIIIPKWKREEDARFVTKYPEIAKLAQQFEPKTVPRRQPPDVKYRGWAKVHCLRVIGLAEIPNSFPSTRSDDVYAYSDSQGDYKGETASLLYLHRQLREAFQWWVITKTSPSRLVMAGLEVIDDPFEICNFDVPRTASKTTPLSNDEIALMEIRGPATNDILHFIGEWPK